MWERGSPVSTNFTICPSISAFSCLAQGLQKEVPHSGQNRVVREIAAVIGKRREAVMGKCCTPLNEGKMKPDLEPRVFPRQ